MTEFNAFRLLIGFIAIALGSVNARADQSNTVSATHGSQSNVMLTVPADIALGQNIANALSVISDNVNQCRRDHPDAPQNCACQYPKEMSALKQSIDDAVQHHSDWAKKSISYTDAKGSRALSLPNLERQIRMCQKK